MGHKSPSSKQWLLTQDRREILATRHADHSLSVANRYATLENAAGQQSVALGAYAYRHNLNLTTPMRRSRNAHTVPFCHSLTHAIVWFKGNCLICGLNVKVHPYE